LAFSSFFFLSHLLAPFLFPILDVTIVFTHICSGAQEKGAGCTQGEWEGGEDGNDVDLDLNLDVAGAARQRKTKNSHSAEVTERVSLP
jgi:hypothetical protein